MIPKIPIVTDNNWRIDTFNDKSMYLLPILR